MRGRILAVDDDPTILDLLRLDLEAEGYEVVTAADACSALRVLDTAPCVLALLDVMLPDTDGFELARVVRERSDIPVIMLSARDADIDKAIGLGVGADDYVTKPFSPIELVARVKAHLRRYDASAGAAGDAVIESGPVRMDVARRRVTVRGAGVELTSKEFEILRMLLERPGRVYTKAQIYERVWGEDSFGDLGTVHVHVHRLRTKIEEHPETPVILATVWGIGYRFEEGR